jgi:hypothetical protein
MLFTMVDRHTETPEDGISFSKNNKKQSIEKVNIPFAYDLFYIKLNNNNK